MRFEDKPDYPFLRKLFRELFIREKFELDFLYDWTEANRVNPTHTSSANKLQIDLKLDRGVNASQLMNQDIGSIFHKGGANPNPDTAAGDKRSKFVDPPSASKNTTNAGHDAATESPVKKKKAAGADDQESSSSKDKPARRPSDDKLIPGQDNSDSEKQGKKDKDGGNIQMVIPNKKQIQLPL